MKRLLPYIVSIALGITFGPILNFGILSLLSLLPSNLSLELIKNYSPITNLVFIPLFFIMPTLIFFLITLLLWKFNNNFKNKFSFLVVIKLNAAFLLGNILFYLCILYLFTGSQWFKTGPGLQNFGFNVK